VKDGRVYPVPALPIGVLWNLALAVSFDLPLPVAGFLGILTRLAAGVYSAAKAAQGGGSTPMDAALAAVGAPGAPAGATTRTERRATEPRRSPSEYDLYYDACIGIGFPIYDEDDSRTSKKFIPCVMEIACED
jgi:hypothetical protein